MDKPENAVFVIDHDPKVLWPVTARIPADGGEFVERTFRVLLRVLPEARYVELLDRNPESDDAPLEGVLAGNAERFPEFVAGWADDLRNAAGEPIPFSVAELRALVVGPYGGPVSTGLWRAIGEIRFKARLGNFAPPPTVGTAEAAAS